MPDKTDTSQAIGGNQPGGVPVHVCHIASALRGGSEIMVAQLAAAQQQAGYKISVVYSPIRDNLEDFRHLFPKDVDFVPWSVEREVSIASDWRAYRRIYDILDRLRPTIVHLHNAKAGAHGRIVCRRLGIASIYTPHGLSFLRKDVSWLGRQYYFWVEWFLALFGGRLVALSQSEYDAIRSIPCPKALINNGLDVETIQSIASETRSERRRERFRIVVSGRIEAQKDPQTVARIATLCPKDWEWIWVGEGALRPVLETEGRFVITGWVSRPEALSLVQSADVFLQASLWEGMSFSLLEAMALGRPSIVSNVAGNRDLIANHVSGYVCERDEDYVAALKQLAQSPEDRARLGERALQCVLEGYSLEVVTQRWLDLYSEVLGRRAASAA